MRVTLFTDTLGQRSGGRGGEIEASMREISKEGRGVIVLIREPLTYVAVETTLRTPSPTRPSFRRCRPGLCRAQLGREGQQGGQSTHGPRVPQRAAPHLT